MGVETELRHDRRLSELLDEVPGSEAPQRKSYRARKKSDPRKFIGTFQTVIDGLPEQIALVDENWDILVVNEAWTTTAAQYGYGDLGPGSNYLQFCERKASEGHSAAAIAAGGAREIASGQKEAFRFIYHGRDQWEGAAFQLCIARVEAEGRRFATITRYDVSELVELRLMRTGYSDLLIEKQADERRRLMGLDLPFTAESAAIARKQLVDWMRQCDAHVDNRHDARLVVSELVSNSVRHARPLTDGTMHVAWNASPAGLDIAVTDGGALSTPEKVDAGVSDLAGRGLAIVETLASRWWVESSRSRTTVHALLELAPTPS